MFSRIMLAVVVAWVATIGFAPAQDASPADALVKEGQKLRDAQDFKGAQNFFEAAYKLEPRNVNVLVNLAWIYNEQQDYDKGLKYSQDALKVSPNHSEALCELGYAHLKLKQYLKALDALRKSIEKDDKNCTAYLYLSETLRAVGEQDEADEIDEIRQKKCPGGGPKK